MLKATRFLNTIPRLSLHDSITSSPVVAIHAYILPYLHASMVTPFIPARLHASIPRYLQLVLRTCLHVCTCPRLHASIPPGFMPTLRHARLHASMYALASPPYLDANTWAYAPVRVQISIPPHLHSLTPRYLHAHTCHTSRHAYKPPYPHNFMPSQLHTSTTFYLHDFIPPRLHTSVTSSLHNFIPT